MNPQLDQLVTILTKAAELGASHCYIAMRRGEGTIFFILNEAVQPIAPCTSDVFAGLHRAACALGGMDHTIPYGSSSYDLDLHGSSLPTKIERFMGLEPALCFTFGLNEPLGMLYAEYSLSSPTTLAMRQLFTSNPRTLYLAGNATTAPQIADTLLKAVYFGVDTAYGGNVLHVGKAPKPHLAHITSQPELNLQAMRPDAVSTTNVSMPVSLVKDLPSVVQAKPRMVLLHNQAGQTVSDGIQLSSLLARDYMPAEWIPILFVYLNLIPRLCQKCRVHIQIKESEYRDLQASVGAKSTTNYAIPETQTASAAIYRYMGTKNIMDQIAQDPDLVNRAANQVRPTAPDTVYVWRKGEDDNCAICNGSGYSGNVLLSGFTDLYNNTINNTATAQELLMDRFWTDVFDKLESGLIAYDDFRRIQT